MYKWTYFLTEGIVLEDCFIDSPLVTGYLPRAFVALQNSRTEKILILETDIGHPSVGYITFLNWRQIEG